MKELLNQINNLEWNHLDDENFESILDEDLDEEFDFLDRKSWEMAEIKISEEDKKGLMEFKEDAIDKYNNFDIILKETYAMKIIDLIDYNKGKVILVRIKDKL